jgi:hypothetical protein
VTPGKNDNGRISAEWRRGNIEKNKQGERAEEIKRNI